MTTIGSIKVGSTTTTMMILLLVMAIFIGYSAYRDKELKIKTTIASMVVLALLGHFLENSWYFTKRSELVDKFRAGGDIVCVEKGTNIIVSKNNGYLLKGEFFIRGEKAIKVDNCYGGY